MDRFYAMTFCNLQDTHANNRITTSWFVFVINELGAKRCFG